MTGDATPDICESLLLTSQFDNGLKDLRNLREQLYAAAECLERSYDSEEHTKFVVESSKDYVEKAVVSTVDHLGSVADKLSRLLDHKANLFSATTIRVVSVEQRLATCQQFSSLAGLSQLSLILQAMRHHKQYANEAEAFQNYTATATEPRNQNPCPGGSTSAHHFAFTTPIPNRKSARGRRSISPFRFPLRRSENGDNRSPSPTPSHKDKHQRPPEPRRSVSAFRRNERDMETYTKRRSMQLFKAMVSAHRRDF